MSDPLFGKILPPQGVDKYASLPGGSAGGGLFIFLSNTFKLVAVIAGIFFIVRIISAGFTYMTASGDPKKTQEAWEKIWQSALGLIIIASAFVLAAVIGRFTGINILKPTIYGP